MRGCKLLRLCTASQWACGQQEALQQQKGSKKRALDSRSEHGRVSIRGRDHCGQVCIGSVMQPEWRAAGWWRRSASGGGLEVRCWLLPFCRPALCTTSATPRGPHLRCSFAADNGNVTIARHAAAAAAGPSSTRTTGSLVRASMPTATLPRPASLRPARAPSCLRRNRCARLPLSTSCSA